MFTFSAPSAVLRGLQPICLSAAQSADRQSSTRLTQCWDWGGWVGDGWSRGHGCWRGQRCVCIMGGGEGQNETYAYRLTQLVCLEMRGRKGGSQRQQMDEVSERGVFIPIRWTQTQSSSKVEEQTSSSSSCFLIFTLDNLPFIAGQPDNHTLGQKCGLQEGAHTHTRRTYKLQNKYLNQDLLTVRAGTNHYPTMRPAACVQCFVKMDLFA